MKGSFQIQTAGILSIHGDASPKSFIRIREHADGRQSGKDSRRKAHNAGAEPLAALHRREVKGPTGNRSESGCNEQLLTRIGQSDGSALQTLNCELSAHRFGS